MLKGISPFIGPDLLWTLCSMGYGDEIVLADAHFLGHTMNENVIHADGVKIPDLIDGILPLFELDNYVDSPLIMMAPVEGDKLDPSVEKAYRKVIQKHVKPAPQIGRIDRYDFYERSQNAYAVVMTGETAKYGNILFVKGVTPIQK